MTISIAVSHAAETTVTPWSYHHIQVQLRALTVWKKRSLSNLVFFQRMNWFRAATNLAATTLMAVGGQAEAVISKEGMLPLY